MTSKTTSNTTISHGIEWNGFTCISVYTPTKPQDICVKIDKAMFKKVSYIIM